MQFLRLTLLLSSLFGLLSCGGPESSSPMVVGGEKFEKGSSSAAVGLLFKINATPGPVQTTRTCTATLLRMDTLLTAAHCLNGYQEQKLSLAFIVASDGTKIKAPLIKAMRIHPSYQAADGALSPYNVALLKLSLPLKSELITSTSLSFKKPEVGQPILTIGAGCEQATSEGNCQGPYSILKYLKALTSTVVENPEGGADIKDAWFYSKSSDGFTADGDEGGPVYIKDGYVIGINTFRKATTQGRVPAYLWLGQAELQAFLVQLDFDDPIPPFIQETTKLLFDIKKSLEACGYDTKQQPIFERFPTDTAEPATSIGGCPPDVQAREVRIRTLLLAAAHVEKAEQAFREGRYDEAQALLNTAKEIFFVALQIGIDLSPLGRVKSAVECYLGKEILPDYKPIEGWNYALTCISAIGLDETILKYGFKTIAATKLGQTAIRRLEAFGASFNFAKSMKQKMAKVVGEEFEKVVAKMKNRLGPAATQKELDTLADVGLKMGAEKGDDFVKVAEIVGDTKRLKQFKNFAENLESAEAMKLKMKPSIGADPLPEFLARTFQSHEIFEVVEPVYIARYYDTAKAGKLGGFWSNRIYKSKDEFYKGSVVFPEWSKAEKMVLIRVEKGERIALGKIKSQNIIGADGLEKSLPDSDEFQFILPADLKSDFIKSGGKPADWLDYLKQQKRITIIEEDLTLPSSW